MPKHKNVVLFDANPLTSPNKSGVGYYSEGILNEIAKQLPDNVEIVAFYFNFLGRKKLNGMPKAQNIKYKEIRFFHPKFLSILRRLGLQVPIELLVWRKASVVIYPNFVSLPSIRKTPSIVTIHDLCFRELPEFVQPVNRKFLNRFVPISIKKAFAVLTISEVSKKAIEKFYGVSDKKIIVTKIPLSIPEKLSSVNRITDDYILFMGTLEPRKNFINLVRAYSLLPAEVKDKYSLILAGGRGWSSDTDFDEVNNLISKGEKIILTGYIDNDIKYNLYKNATLYVQPSYYEGYGLPITEALSLGTPVLANDLPVFHEVGANMIMYTDASEVNKLERTLNRILSSESEIKNLKNLAKGYNSQDSREQTAEKIHKGNEAAVKVK